MWQPPVEERDTTVSRCFPSSVLITVEFARSASVVMIWSRGKPLWNRTRFALPDRPIKCRPLNLPAYPPRRAALLCGGLGFFGQSRKRRGLRYTYSFLRLSFEKTPDAVEHCADATLGMPHGHFPLLGCYRFFHVLNNGYARQFGEARLPEPGHVGAGRAGVP